MQQKKAHFHKKALSFEIFYFLEGIFTDNMLDMTCFFLCCIRCNTKYILQKGADCCMPLIHLDSKLSSLRSKMYIPIGFLLNKSFFL